jgi:nucleoside-diphosphate-sugar epimerase
MTRVLISGCGYVGGALAGLLAREGYEVFGLRRETKNLPSGVTPVPADFTDKDSLARELPEDLDYVFHTASPGISGSSTAGERDAAYRDAYVKGPSNLISTLRSRGESPRRILLTSSTGVYAQTGGEWVDETSATEPTGPGRFMLEGERALLGSPFPAVVLRLAGIYGPGRTGALDRARRYRLADSSGEETHYTNRIHRDDCAGALRHLALLQSLEDVYIGADHEPSTPSAVAAWLAESYPETRREDSAIPGGDTSRSGRGSRTNKRCNNVRLVASGYNFRYPTFREGFASLLGD